MTLQELQKKITAETYKGAAALHQFDGLLKLYEAATIAQSSEQMAMYRDQLHSSIDARLDAITNMTHLMRKRLMNDLTDD